MQETCPFNIARRPFGKVDVVLDTDMYNEIDDPFALGYLLASREKLCLKAVYAAPFFNERLTIRSQAAKRMVVAKKDDSKRV